MKTALHLHDQIVEIVLVPENDIERLALDKIRNAPKQEMQIFKEKDGEGTVISLPEKWRGGFVEHQQGMRV
jgi:hypothetical protein